jgi:flagellar biosynthetic protein FliR
MIISVAQAQQFFLAFTRIMAVLIHIPMLGGQTVPSQVRIAFGLVLAAVMLPWQPLPPEATALGLFGFAAAILAQLIIGTLAGFAANLTFGAVQIAGETMGIGSGFGSGRVFNPAMGESGSVFDQFFVMVAVLLFLVIDAHHIFLVALQRTFTILPLDAALPVGALDTMLRLTAQLIAAGVEMALPVLAALLLTDLTLGLLARVAPQVQVFFLGLPLKVGVSLAALGILFSVLLPMLSSLYNELGPRMLLLLGAK